MVKENGARCGARCAGDGYPSTEKCKESQKGCHTGAKVIMCGDVIFFLEWSISMLSP